MNDPAFVHRVQAGIRLIEQGELERAERLFRELTAAHPRDAGLWNLLGTACMDGKRFAESCEAYRRAHELDRRNPEYVFNLGCALLQLGEAGEAIIKFRAALAANPNHPVALLNLGRALRVTGDLARAETTLKKALQRDPRRSGAYENLYLVLARQGRLGEAEQCLRDGLLRLPDSGDLHFELALFLLKFGRFGEGWKEYQWRFNRWELLAGAGLSFWTCSQSPLGARLDGQRIELREEQGLGDMLFFLRFAAQLRQRGAKTVLYLPSRLVEIVRRAACADEVHDRDSAPAMNRETMFIGDLPFLLGMCHAEQAPPPLTLKPLPERVDALRLRLQACGPPPYIGLAWRAGLEVADPYLLKKEIPLPALAGAVAGLPGTLLVLQRDPREGEIARFAALAGRPVFDEAV